MFWSQFLKLIEWCLVDFDYCRFAGKWNKWYFDLVLPLHNPRTHNRPAISCDASNKIKITEIAVVALTN